jgi:hypothetical protein
MVVEQDKPAHELGTYVHPELYGMTERSGLTPREQSILAAASDPVDDGPVQEFDPNDGE